MKSDDLFQQQTRVLDKLADQLVDYYQMLDKFDRRTKDGYGPGDAQFAEWLIRKGHELLADMKRELDYGRYLLGQH